MEFFAKSGSLCNAYTTFRNTSYLFYATKDLKENIEYLLNYVQNIYLTEDDVEKKRVLLVKRFICMRIDQEMCYLRR